MKRLGLIGGMSWESTAVYYRALNTGVRDQLGGLHSADLVLRSLDFAPIAAAQATADWEALGQQMVTAAAELEAAGADLLLLCTNTLHKVADHLQAHSALPLLHIGDASGQALAARGIQRVALLGTRFTMSDGFYRDHLSSRFNLTVLTPDPVQQASLHDIIFTELCRGQILDASRTRIAAIIDGLLARGAEAVLLACTELGLIIPTREAPIPVLDTTLLHVDFALHAALARY
jgi:aspartate racemase